MNQIYLYQNGERSGPHSLDAIQSWISSGRLGASDLVWFDGCSDWVSVSETPGIILREGGQGARTADLPPFEAYLGEDPYLFVSYSHQDAHLVYPEISLLRDAGYNIWYDEGVEASNEWPEEIAKAVLACSVFICFMSPRATESINCRNEINLALNERKPFLAIHLEETELPPGLRLRMGDLQAIVKNKVPQDRYLNKVVTSIDQLLGRKSRANLGAAERASSLFVSRNGQTFGPYSFEQAKQYLHAGQLLHGDLALLEGQTEWKTLVEALSILEESNQRKVEIPTETPSLASPGPGPKRAKRNAKTIKAKGLNARSSTVRVKEKSLVSKLIATVVVFLLTMIVVGGSTLGAYLIAPSQIGPVVRKFGLPIESWFPGREIEMVEVVEAPPESWEDIRLPSEQMYLVKKLLKDGTQILPMKEGNGFRVISSSEKGYEMNDDSLKDLLSLSQHVVVLDLTNSQVGDAGLVYLQRFPNLRSLVLEGSSKVTASGVKGLSQIRSLESLNLVRVTLEDAVIDSLTAMEGLMEVYLYQTGLSGDAINRLKETRPRMFVNAG